MQQIRGNSTINKLILLFVFDKMEIPLSEQSAVDICDSNDWISYMDLMPILKELVDSEFIHITKSKNGEELHTLTPQGRTCLANFYKRIPSTTREEISNFARNNRLKYRRKQEYIADYIKNIDGTYSVILKIIEPTQNTFDLKLIVPNKATAKSIYEKWEDKAAQIFFTIYEQLIE